MMTLTNDASGGVEVAVHEERQRLAEQLHDTVGAMLFTIGAGVRRLGVDLSDDPDLLARLKVIERQTVEATAMFRESLQALHAPPDSLALAVSVRADARCFEERTGVPTRLVVADDLPALPASRASVLVAVVREALLNVEKHARAGAVLVNVFRTHGGVSVAVQDDGVGLPADWEARAGLGFAAATGRLGRVGGRIRIDGNGDGGVTVRAWIPCRIK
jgi:signal transduction histidine kinase